MINIGLSLGSIPIFQGGLAEQVVNLIPNSDNPLADGWFRSGVSDGTSAAQTLSNGIAGFSASATAGREVYFSNQITIDPGTYTLSTFIENAVGAFTRPVLYFDQDFAGTSLFPADAVGNRASVTFTFGAAQTGRFRWGIGTNAAETGSADLGGIQLVAGTSPGTYTANP